MKTAENQNILQVPFDRLIAEGRSQKDRLLGEVMGLLFGMLPKTQEESHTMTLSDGTKCWVKAFSPPKIRSDGETRYGFDVVFAQPYPLSHLEFSVKCSGWERSMG